MGGRVVAAMALLAVLLGVWRRVPVYDAFVRGARTGLRTAVSIAPALLAVLPAAAALTASGATDALCALLSPALSALRLPEQAVPLMLLRPLSGAGALGIWIFILLERLLIPSVGRTAARGGWRAWLRAQTRRCCMCWRCTWARRARAVRAMRCLRRCWRGRRHAWRRVSYVPRRVGRSWGLPLWVRRGIIKRNPFCAKEA